MPESLNVYLALCPKINPLSHLGFFRQFNNVEGISGEQQFLERVGANFEVLKGQFREIVEQSKSGSLPIFVVRKYFGQIMTKNFSIEIDPLLALGGHSMDELGLLREAVDQNNLIETLNNLALSLVELLKVVPVEAPLLEKAGQYSALVEQVLQESGPGILGRAFNAASQSFIAALRACGVREIDRGNEQIKLVQELSLGGELLALYRKDIQDRLEFN